MEILIPILILGAIGLVLGMFLAYASKKFHVEPNPKVEKIIEALPGANCGACGFPGCSGYAEAIVAGQAEITACAPGGPKVAKDISDIMGVDGDIKEGKRKVARLKCSGNKFHTKDKYEFDAELKTCSTASLYYGGDKSCLYGCLGYGECVGVCPVGAITIDEGIAKIDEDKCISCGKCVKTCPKKVITMVDEDADVFVSCSSREKPAVARQACTVACIGCGLCARSCPVDAITVNGNLAVIDQEKCIKCGLCATKCPTKAIHSVVKPKVAKINDKCIGCTACSRVCPVDAITGTVKNPHEVDPNKCIGCGLCEQKCKFNAIDMLEK